VYEKLETMYEEGVCSIFKGIIVEEVRKIMKSPFQYHHYFDWN
jgi:hypothetical protein